MNFVDQTLDGKYQIERELGRGGMGTVYLATHLGTERPVAVKIISPQFMERAEFVKRFRREARAAGRLRHPNVVNVTDFGFADTKDGQVAYLVMEYLDGCTLGEILDEEKNLPVGWTLDIIDQVCSAVHEAHQQGIIHRDLKPDNIWLEPNQRGGYTVKVLDFGIVKLEEHLDEASNGEIPESFARSMYTLISDPIATIAGADAGTRFEGLAGTQVSEKATIAQFSDYATQLAPVQPTPAQTDGSENRTAIMASSEADEVSPGDQDTVGTKLISGADGPSSRTIDHSLQGLYSSAELTRVGAVLGTPLYMSPEQCRGEHLDAKSDVYSLGVIAYQMLSGRTPFEGDFKDVMEAHKNLPPPPLKARKVRKKMSSTIIAALSKDPEARPQTAEAFASNLRSRSEGIFELLRRALVIYSEHLPKYLLLSGFFSIPIIVLTLTLLGLQFLKAGDAISSSIANIGIGVDGFALTLASAFCTNLLVGTISWIVIQYLAVPLRPVRLRPALKEARRKWKRVAGAGFLTALSPFVLAAIGGIAGFAVIAALMGILYPLTNSVSAILIGGGVGALILGFIGFCVAYILFILVPPVVMLENVGVIAALKRSAHLVRRSFPTAMGAVFIMLLIPAIIAGTISFVVNISAKAFERRTQAQTEVTDTPRSAEPENANTAAVEAPKENDSNWNWTFGRQNVGIKKKEPQDVGSRLRTTFFESLIQIFWLPMQILVFSFSAIIVALLYLKTRMAGGESVNDLIERFEDDGRPRKKWQERVRQRLIQSGRISSKS
ncbi:hypothetical protein BH20ACI2_BH20ACI2_01000 [soil metagenome]